jgi:hypothetical protein
MGEGELAKLFERQLDMLAAIGYPGSVVKTLFSKKERVIDAALKAHFQNGLVFAPVVPFKTLGIKEQLDAFNKFYMHRIYLLAEPRHYSSQVTSVVLRAAGDVPETSYYAVGLSGLDSKEFKLRTGLFSSTVEELLATLMHSDLLKKNGWISAHGSETAARQFMSFYLTEKDAAPDLWLFSKNDRMLPQFITFCWQRIA